MSIQMAQRFIPHSLFVVLSVAVGMLPASTSWAIAITEEQSLPEQELSSPLLSLPMPQDEMEAGVNLQALSAVAVMRKGLWRQALEMSAGVLAEQTPNADALGVFAVAGAVLGDARVVEKALPRLREIKGETYYGPLVQGIATLQKGQTKQARKQIDALLAKHPGDPIALYFRGEILNLEGNSKAALQDFQGALKSAPEFAPALVAAARLLSVEQVPEEAIAMVERAVAIDPQRSEYRVRLAELLDRAGQHERARELYIELLQAMPGMEHTYLRRAWQLFQEGNDRQALELVDKIFKIYGPLAQGHLIRAMASVNLGQGADVERHLSAYLAASDEGVDAHFGAGLCYLAAGNGAKAGKHFQSVLELQPNNLQAKTNLAVVEQLAGRNDKARAELAQVGAAGEESAVVDFIGANLELAEGRPEDYKQRLRRTETLLPGAANLKLVMPTLASSRARALAGHRNMMLLMFLNQWNAQVIRYADFALKTLNDDSVSLYFRGMALTAQGRLKEAEKSLRQAVALEPKFVAAQMALAGVLLDQGQQSESLAVLEKTEGMVQGAQALLQLAVINERIGKHAKARELVHKVLASTEQSPLRQQAEALLSQLEGGEQRGDK